MSEKNILKQIQILADYQCQVCGNVTRQSVDYPLDKCCNIRCKSNNNIIVKPHRLYGKKVLARDFPGNKWQARFFICEGYGNKAWCVSESSEDEFIKGGAVVGMTYWNIWKEIEDA